MSQFLNEQDYYRTVYGGWLGKNIGGTLGARDEGRKERLHLSYYPVVPDGPLENDDLDLQLVWLHALEQYGPRLTAKELGQEWIDHVFFPYDEYGYALANLRRGLLPPVSGSFNNPFTHCMGSPIRSEIWAMVTPGSPELAVRYAYEDAIVDHAGGEGVYGEMFLAAIESAIFFEKDRDRLLAIGLRYIPEQCRTALAVKDLIEWHGQGLDWLTARELVIEHHGHDNFTDAPQNIAFTVLGWLYGADFEDAILKAVNCGYDTDCTAATLGAILGMILGPENLPAKWKEPLGDGIVVSPPVKGFDVPANLHELTVRTIRMGKKVLAEWESDIIIHPDVATDLSVACAAACAAAAARTAESADCTASTAHTTGENPNRTAKATAYTVEAAARTAETAARTAETAVRTGETAAYSAEMADCVAATAARTANSAADEEIRRLWARSVTGNRWLLPEYSSGACGLELTLDYGTGGPAIGVKDKKELSFTLTNRSKEKWEVQLALCVPNGWECDAPVSAELEPDEPLRFSFSVASSDVMLPSYECTLRIARRHDDRQWADIRVPFSLVAAAHWRLEGPDAERKEAVLPGNRIGWHETLYTEAAGQYRAITRMIVPESRSVRLIAAANCAAAVNLNGKRLIAFEEGAEFMPAFHRAPADQYAELVLEAGSYELEIIAVKNERPLEVYVLPVATARTKQPGPFYYYTDILFGPPE